MKFIHQSFDTRGGSVNGEIEASDKGEAIELLRGKGLYVSEISASAISGVANGGAMGLFGAGRRLRHLAMFSRQMQVLVSSGTPLVQALSAVERQADDSTWRPIVRAIRETVEQGTPMSEAMRRFPRMFDALTLSLISAGETSGDMASMLDRLATLSRKQLKLRSMISGALIYPCVLIVIGVIVMLTMLMFVLPRFSDLFNQLDAALPPTTQFLMWLSRALWDYWWLLIPLLIGAVVAGFWLSRKPHTRAAVENLLMRLPKVGKIIRSLMTARVARMLGVLLESKVTLLSALKLSRESLTHALYIQLIAQAEDAVSRGEPVSSVLSTSDLISAPVQEALRTGEQSGRLGSPLVQMADFLDEENDVVVNTLAKLIEPVILIGLGVMIGFVAVSMFLPLFDLVSAAQKGGH